MVSTIDGSTITDLYTENNTTWHILQRDGGSVCLYCTHPGVSAHFVVYDTVDGAPPNAWAQSKIDDLANMHSAIGALLAQVA